MNVQRFFIRRPAGSEQGINEPGKAICFADYDICIFALLGIRQLSRQELGCPTDSTQWVFDFMSELSNHLSPGTVLN